MSTWPCLVLVAAAGTAALLAFLTLIRAETTGADT